MGLPNDLKDYAAPLGAFQIISESVAFAGLIALALGLLIFAPYIK